MATTACVAAKLDGDRPADSAARAGDDSDWLVTVQNRTGFSSLKVSRVSSFKRTRTPVTQVFATPAEVEPVTDAHVLGRLLGAGQGAQQSAPDAEAPPGFAAAACCGWATALGLLAGSLSTLRHLEGAGQAPSVDDDLRHLQRQHRSDPCTRGAFGSSTSLTVTSVPRGRSVFPFTTTGSSTMAGKVRPTGSRSESMSSMILTTMEVPAGRPFPNTGGASAPSRLLWLPESLRGFTPTAALNASAADCWAGSQR